jgi:hypothetical protein
MGFWGTVGSPHYIQKPHSFIKVEHSRTEIKKSYLVALLSELKQLKELKLGTHAFVFNFDSKFVVQTIQNYGKEIRIIVRVELLVRGFLRG